jgi:hypothetical protein
MARKARKQNRLDIFRLNKKTSENLENYRGNRINGEITYEVIARADNKWWRLDKQNRTKQT